MEGGWRQGEGTGGYLRPISHEQDLLMKVRETDIFPDNYSVLATHAHKIHASKHKNSHEGESTTPTHTPQEVAEDVTS